MTPTEIVFAAIGGAILVCLVLLLRRMSAIGAAIELHRLHMLNEQEKVQNGQEGIYNVLVRIETKIRDR